MKLKEDGEGVVFPVWIQPKASKTEISDIKDGILKIRITSPPVEGKANQELCRFIARTLKIKRSQVEILSGMKSRTKLIRIKGVKKEEGKKLCMRASANQGSGNA